MKSRAAWGEMRPPRSTTTPAAGAGIPGAGRRFESPSSGVSDHDAATFDRLIARLIGLMLDLCEPPAGLTPSAKGSVSVISIGLLAKQFEAPALLRLRRRL
jgi:hypothetical protein